MTLVADAALRLVEAGKQLHRWGMVPATSGNLSCRLDDGTFLVTGSGLDKGSLTAADFLRCGLDGTNHGPAVPPGVHAPRLRPSAETSLHRQQYARDAAIGAVLHVHSVAATVLSMKQPGARLEITGLELLKALEGVTTHEERVVLPILDNHQDMQVLGETLAAWEGGRAPRHGFLVRGHGLYTWGADLRAAMRHVETLDFLFRCTLALHHGTVV